MEVLGFIQEMLHSVAEYVASYRLGQGMLRQADRLLWTIEKSARWAVPPPLDERPQPELIRPLPWVFFLMLLVVLRVTRESISLINLVFGKPPLRSADVVTYIQGKRRYLRTLKYQGSRALRARSTGPATSWCSSVQSLLEFTMCFRRRHCDNNNTTRVSNNDEVLVVKRNKHGGQEASPVLTTSETTMERLIEKMMVDLQADSDDDSSYTLTNPMSSKSDQSADDADSEQEQINNDVSNKIHQNDSCQSTSNKENDIDKLNHRDTVINDNDLISEMSAKNESLRLLQSERCLKQNNKAGNSALRHGIANGKSVCTTSTYKDCSVKSPNKSPLKP